MIYISFSIKSVSAHTESTEQFEVVYNSVYKPLIKFLNKNPELKFSLGINGPFITYLKRRRKEFITLLKQLVDNKQIEILGGGYYDPILPLLLSVDRNGQIDELSAEIRQTVGKRPRGISLFADCWDASLVNSLQICGLEYVLLDNCIIPKEKKVYLPLIMNNLGKTIDIYPTYKDIGPNSSITPAEFINNILELNKLQNKKSSFVQFVPDRIINIELEHYQLASLLETKWFDGFLTYLKNNPETEIKTTTVQIYNKINKIKEPVYISSGINEKFRKLTKARIGGNLDTITVQDFMEAFPLSKKVYNRTLYLGMLINQYKKDKMRKASARDKLWLAQAGATTLIQQDGEFIESRFRQSAYKRLTEAEKILRENDNFKESITTFDYNGDGLNEYVCRMKNYFSYISPVSGALQELEILKGSGNYIDSPARKVEFDTYDDNYERGFFIDHFFNEAQLEQYLAGKPSGDGVFSRIIYSELKFVNNHHEIQLFAKAFIGKNKQEVLLKKKYIINSDGMNVQYIIKNLSSTTLKGHLAVESNIAHTNYNSQNPVYYNMELVSADNIDVIDSSKNLWEQNLKLDLNTIDMVRITDSEGGISFGFEPNESCKYTYNPITFLRSDRAGNKVPVHMAFVSTFYWDINLEPEKELEKTINFSITTVKKVKKGKE